MDDVLRIFFEELTERQKIADRVLYEGYILVNIANRLKRREEDRDNEEERDLSRDFTAAHESFRASLQATTKSEKRLRTRFPFVDLGVIETATKEMGSWMLVVSSLNNYLSLLRRVRVYLTSFEFQATVVEMRVRKLGR